MEVFTVKEVANYLGCSTSIIRKLILDKKIPFYRVGSRILFRKIAIDNWVHEQEKENIIQP